MPPEIRRYFRRSRKLVQVDSLRLNHIKSRGPRRDSRWGNPLRTGDGGTVLPGETPVTIRDFCMEGTAMKKLQRLLLAAGALLLGGGLGSVLLPWGGALGTLAFLGLCALLGRGFYRLDQRIPR